MNPIANIIKDILIAPQQFYELGNISIYSLLGRSGYFERYEEVNEDGILQMLSECPGSIEQWMSWSENKRTSSGWFFEDNDRGGYTVGYISEKGYSEIQEFKDVNEACARFVKLEIEAIRVS